MVFTEDFSVTDCGNLPNAFYAGCLPGWISTSGTPDIISSSPFQGRYGYCRVSYNGFCTPNSERSESIAINYQFLQGATYRISYQVIGNVGTNPATQFHTPEWILANGLSNQTALIAPPCNPNLVTLPIPVGSHHVNSIADPIVFNEDTWTYNSHIFTAPADFDYMWFRNSTLSTSNGMNNYFAGHMALDNVVIEIVEEAPPCNANFKIQLNNQSTGISSLDVILIDANLSISYMEIIQNGTTIHSGPPQSFLLPHGPYTVCIVARNNKTGEECKSCQELCIGENKGSLEWKGKIRAEEWEKKSLESNIKTTPEESKDKELEESLNPTITPNPLNGAFVISSLNMKVEMTEIAVYDMNSRIVYSLNSIQNQSSISVDLKDQQSGIYIVKVVYSDGSVGQQKVVVENNQ